ncbi:hypothetical protein IV79_GL001081 [Pediococcus claussenii]|nr:hypothetical protein IV79_GL001081 [Pediococcus claussenii]
MDIKIEVSKLKRWILVSYIIAALIWLPLIILHLYSMAFVPIMHNGRLSFFNHKRPGDHYESSAIYIK